MADDELRALKQDLEEVHALHERLTELLDGVATGLKGEAPELVLHDWSDLPALAKRMREALEEIAAGYGCKVHYGTGCDKGCVDTARKALWRREE
jgi:hypothetical protein